MLFKKLSNKKIAIWGMGKEGTAILSALLKYVDNPSIILITEENVDDIQSCDVLIKSPGVSLYRDEIKKAKENGIICTSGTNLFLANKPEHTKVIGVTGTKGKSTTSSLLYHTLKEAGLSVELGGNIGKPLIELLETACDFVVAELSSYQCADLSGKIDIAILTNLYHEHLQWHHTHEQYYNDKINMLKQSSLQILNGAQEPIQLFANPLSNPLFFNTEDDIHLNNDTFFEKKTPLLRTNTLNLRGEHNAQNACAVLSVTKILGIPVDICQKAFKTFQALPHRLQIVATQNGVTFVDDSISTTPETAIAAVKSFDSGQFITLIVGGLDREQDFTCLMKFLEPIKNRCCLITLPETGDRAYHQAKELFIPTYRASTMKQAVHHAKEITPKGGVVLLSPASPSYNQYRNFEERGADFQKRIFEKKNINIS